MAGMVACLQCGMVAVGNSDIINEGAGLGVRGTAGRRWCVVLRAETVTRTSHTPLTHSKLGQNTHFFQSTAFTINDWQTPQQFLSE